jgi:hypothetical protein
MHINNLTSMGGRFPVAYQAAVSLDVIPFHDNFGNGVCDLFLVRIARMGAVGIVEGRKEDFLGMPGKMAPY